MAEGATGGSSGAQIRQMVNFILQEASLSWGGVGLLYMVYGSGAVESCCVPVCCDGAGDSGLPCRVLCPIFVVVVGTEGGRFVARPTLNTHNNHTPQQSPNKQKK